MYAIKIVPKAQEHLASLKRSEPSAFKKVLQLLDELALHPKIGTGHPEPLKGDYANLWSRRITKKHRLIYEILEQEVLVLILSAYGHYEDK